MNSRRRFITEPGDRRWLRATPRAAAAGGMLVALLLVAMIVLPPGERPNAGAGRAARSTPGSVEASTLPAATVGALVPASSSPALPLEAPTEASPEP